MAYVINVHKQSKEIILYPKDLTDEALKTLTDEGFIDENSEAFGIITLYKEMEV